MVTDEFRFADLMASSIHDMKNALNLQVSALEQIARDCQDRGDTATFDKLGQVIYQTNHMSLGLMELLSLYKLGDASYPLDITQHRVSDVIEEAVLHNQFMMHSKGIAVSADCAPECFWYLDKELVKGVLLNALNNAYQHTRDAIRITARQHPQHLELRVEDNGTGYPDSMLHSGDAGSDQGVNFSTGSTGLGLHFSRQVAHLHKNAGARGQLRIENGGTLGGGCFVLTLP
ncbi:HAMP domain-containing sensor histidine kinase [Rhodoferax sp. GW822-FHT02A01]|uniref:sensor histidine kinase n=1 Tax=Rhodoferax sp. GW822-FHT02A01 TaxID=3141537 RepID=UPI00315CF75F